MLCPSRSSRRWWSSGSAQGPAPAHAARPPAPWCRLLRACTLRGRAGRDDPPHPRAPVPRGARHWLARSNLEPEAPPARGLIRAGTIALEPRLENGSTWNLIDGLLAHAVCIGEVLTALLPWIGMPRSIGVACSRGMAAYYHGRAVLTWLGRWQRGALPAWGWEREWHGWHGLGAADWRAVCRCRRPRFSDAATRRRLLSGQHVAPSLARPPQERQCVGHGWCSQSLRCTAPSRGMHRAARPSPPSGGGWYAGADRCRVLTGAWTGGPCLI